MDNKQKWYELIERVYKITSKATMPCVEVCPTGACEAVGSGELVVFLPYEMEYINEKIKATENKFTLKEIDGFIYGTMPDTVPCPFLSGKECSIRAFRPFDCRSFPLLPRFHLDKKGMEFFLIDYCPLKDKLSKEFIKRIIKAWKLLEPELPLVWKKFYNLICQYGKPLLSPK
ncbi:MAG: hypothetical protein AB1393_07165 [Candidatus Edwardsbacteria bacterium]